MKGYVLGNVWWVHKNVNLMKRDLELKQFISLCKIISDKNKKIIDNDTNNDKLCSDVISEALGI